MAVLRFLLALAAAVAVHAFGTRFFPGLGRGLDLFLVVTVLQGLSGRSLAGLLGGWAAGLTKDALTGGPFGLYGFAFTLIGYGTARLAQRLVVQRGPSVALLVAGVSLLTQLVVAGASFLALPFTVWPDPLWSLVQAAGSGAVAGAIFSLAATLRSSAETRKQQRVKRLRWD